MPFPQLVSLALQEAHLTTEALRVGRDHVRQAASGPNTLLHFAVQRGDEARVGELLDTGADPNAAGFLGFTPMHLAVHRYGRRAETMLSCAVEDRIIQRLLAAGADLTKRDSVGTLPAAMGHGSLPRSLRDAMAVLTESGAFSQGDDEYTDSVHRLRRGFRKWIAYDDDLAEAA